MCWLAQYKIKRAQKQLNVMQQFRVHNLPSDMVLKKEIKLYYRLANIYLSLHGNKKFPFARESALACYRSAAGLDDANAQFLLGKSLLDEARFRNNLQEGRVLASEANLSEMHQRYKEAHIFLTAAIALNHIYAKRLLGLCYINGWGASVDKSKGFDLVIASIEQEQSWDRVQKIFMQMGINQPAFFSELFQHRNKK